MERPLPQKSSSFSASTVREDKKLRETDRNLSLDSIKRDRSSSSATKDDDGSKPSRIDEGDEEGADATTTTNGADDSHPINITTLSEDIDRLISALAGGADPPPPIPDAVDRFVALVEREIIRYESGDEKWSPEAEQIPLLPSVSRLSRLSSSLSPDPSHFEAMSRASGVLHHSMCFLEDELFSLLDEPRARLHHQHHQDQISKPKRGHSFNRSIDQSAVPQSPAAAAAADAAPADTAPAYPPEVVARMRAIAGAMLSGGYETECRQVFSVARRNAVEAAISEQGFEKVSIDDVQRMSWDSLEAEIAKWNKAFRHCVTECLPYERTLCEEVFSGEATAASPAAAAADIFHDLATSVLFHLLNFAEAVAMTKRSAEKLFKVLDMFEAIRDMTPRIEDLFSPPAAATDGEAEHKRNTEEGEDEELPPPSSPAELRSEISSARARIGDAAVGIFCDLEGSIKSDTGKTPVPGGAVHPLTRYVMNYLKYACEYNNTLEQVFREHQKLEKGPSLTSSDYDGSGGGGAAAASPFALQLLEVMDLLQSSIEGKSKLYKDQALSNIFMMNNGRYIVQKIKGSAEINQVLGDTWCRKRSSELRQYHKNYQRETWAKVLGCLRDDGLTTARGSVQKPVLKERFKSFNAMFEEIHKAQSTWVVSDEQLQSELRVSVSAVVVPAYRSFLGRFSQYLDPGRQTEKYIKFGAEDLETYIDDLFDGNPQSMVRRRT